MPDEEGDGDRSRFPEQYLAAGSRRCARSAPTQGAGAVRRNVGTVASGPTAL